MVRTAAFERAAGRRSAQILDVFEDSLERRVKWMLPLHTEIVSTSRLAALAIGDDERTAEQIARRLTDLLEPLARQGLETAARWPEEVHPEDGLDVEQAVRRLAWPSP